MDKKEGGWKGKMWYKEEKKRKLEVRKTKLEEK
jgi:hypothetical protein